jgi:hypothetical protein
MSVSATVSTQAADLAAATAAMNAAASALSAAAAAQKPAALPMVATAPAPDAAALFESGAKFLSNQVLAHDAAAHERNLDTALISKLSDADAKEVFLARLSAGRGTNS